MRVKRNNQQILPNNNNNNKQRSASCSHLSGAKINVISLILRTDYFLSSCVVVAIAHALPSQLLGPWWAPAEGMREWKWMAGCAWALICVSRC